jgi:tRNA pseudouridine synthase 10
MLGTGRPFILELAEAKTAISGAEKVESIEKEINCNPDVKVIGLSMTKKTKFEEIRDGEENKLKVYAAIVWTEKKIGESDILALNSAEKLEIKQKTPIRVMHRRSLKTREKQILKMHAEKLNDHFMLLRLVTSGGTYVKEFVHGDLWRTRPSISELLSCKSDILQLDVLGLGSSLSEVSALLYADFSSSF